MGKTWIAKWNGEIIAQSDNCLEVEGNMYFPESDVKKEFLTDSSMTSVCPWKGTASYYSIEVNGEVNTDAAWYYKEPSEAAKDIKGRIAFWKGVDVSEAK